MLKRYLKTRMQKKAQLLLPPAHHLIFNVLIRSAANFKKDLNKVTVNFLKNKLYDFDFKKKS